MAEPISIQQLKDASLDAKTLEEAVNGDAVTTVLSRLGETYPTLSNALNQIDSKLDSADAQIKQGITNLFENGGLPATPFATKALMTASSLENDKYAMVTDDTVNNGLYVKTAGAWVKSEYSAVPMSDEVQFLYDFYDVGGRDVQKLLEERYYLSESFIRAGSGVVEAAKNNPNAYVTNYHTIDPDANEIVVSGWSIGGVTALYAFYDSARVRLSAPVGNSGGLQVKTILKEDIPENAEYIRYTGWKGGDSYITGATLIEINNVSEQIVYSVINKENIESINNIAEIGVPDSTYEELRDLTSQMLGESLYLDVSGDATPANNIPTLRVSNYLVIDKSQEKLIIDGFGYGIIYIYALYDENKTKISVKTGTIRQGVNITLLMSEIPENAKYIRITGDIRYPMNVEGVFPVKLTESIKEEVLEGVNLEAIEKHNLTSLFVTGASFTHSANTWFGEANRKLGTTGVNKARSGTGRPSTDAVLFWRGTMVTDEQFEDIDVFSFMYANVHDLDSEEGLKDKAEDYTADFDIGVVGNPFTAYSEAQCMDYVLRHLQERCYAQKDNPISKWFGTKHGKPLNVMFVTSWHDGRPYNSIPVRVLAARWGAAVCELDKKIGFSKERTLPDGKQVSTLYSQDNEVVDGLTIGWHPKRGDSSQYIQNKIATIYKQSIIEYFGD